MTNKDKYIDFCKSNEVPLHYQYWFWDAIAFEIHWDLAIVENKSGEIIAAWPFVLKKNKGIQIVSQLPLIDYSGPIFAKGIFDKKTKAVYKRSLEYELISKLILQLPNTEYSNFYLSPHLQNWKVFKDNGFQVLPIYTHYLINQPFKKAYEGFKRKLYTDLRKANAQYRIEENGNLLDFNACTKSSFDRQDMKSPYDSIFMERLWGALNNKSSGQILLAHNKETGENEAGLIIAWDVSTIYMLFSGMEHSSKGHALKGLYLYAIKKAMDEGKNLDFCGSEIFGVRKVMEAFGAEPIPYYRIFKSKNRLFHLIASVRGII